MAQEQVAEAIDIHVLCERDLTGNRYIKEISEVTSEGGGEILSLYRYRDGTYERTGLPTKALLERMAGRMDSGKRELVRRFFNGGVET
jgi:hypothetical protein